MKNKTIQSNQLNSTRKSRWNIFKVVAIVVVVMFALILGVGLFKMHQAKGNFVKLDNTQIDAAKAIATNDLESKGKNVSEYEVKVMPQAQRMNFEKKHEEKGSNINEPDINEPNEPSDSDKNPEDQIVGVEVTFSKSKEIQFYLIDVNSNQILMHSETDFYTEECPGLRPLMPPMGSKPGEFGKKTASRWFHGGWFS